MKRYFITGTDTDCGKTYVTCQLLDYLNRTCRAQALKPIATGCYEENGQLKSDDVQALQAHNVNPRQGINYRCYAPPISPHLAANAVNEALSIEKIVSFCERSEFKLYDYLLIEGAGGLCVPLNAHATWVDFLKMSETPVILVVGIRLGCINHALLTTAVLEYFKIPLAGWVANCLDPLMQAKEENIVTLSEKIPAPLITTVAYKGIIDTIYSFSSKSERVSYADL